MNISRQHRLVKWAYWSPIRNRRELPSQMSLCAFFWEGMVLGTVLNALVAVMLPIVYPLYLCATSGERRNERRRARLGQLPEAEQRAWYRRQDVKQQRRRLRREAIRNSLFMQALRTIKGRVCPLIEFDE